MSTVSAGVSARVAKQAGRAGVEYLRCPVRGNPVVVRSGNLTLIVSGSEATARRLDPLLHAIGPKVFYVGEGERAPVVKLVLQVLVGGIPSSSPSRSRWARRQASSGRHCSK